MHSCIYDTRRTVIAICCEDLREYLTVDRWASRAAYEAFRDRFSSEYRQLDRRLEELTEEEALIGTFEVLG